MISFKEAQEIIYHNTELLPLEERDIVKCNDKVLGEDIYSKDNLPPFNKSAMDGYAIKSEDTESASDENIVEFKIKNTIKAGEYCTEVLEHGEVFKILTGAPVPSCADSVIEIEKVKVENNKIYIREKVKKGKNIIKLGEELREGKLALKKDIVIRPSEIGLLASLGYKKVNVYKSPIVALIITGDELLDIDSKLVQGKIRNSNEYALTALIENTGVKVLSFGIVCDDKAILSEKIKLALNEADIVITSGGVSAGDYDFIEEILGDIGADIKFNKVAIKPGKPITFATYKKKLFFGLPGNPLSVINTFEEFVKPSIKKIMGKNDFSNEDFNVILSDNFKSKIGRRDFVYVDLKKENEIYYAHKIGSQSSNQLVTISKSNGVIIIPEDVEEVHVGESLNGRFIFK